MVNRTDKMPVSPRGRVFFRTVLAVLAAVGTLMILSATPAVVCVR